MIVLDTFGPAFGLPDASPFVIKAMVLLKMSGLEHETRTSDPRKAPKGKFPVLHDGDTTVADSSFIRWHLETARSIDLDSTLSGRQKAIGWAVEKLLEDNLYWVIMHERWSVEENFDKGPRHFFDVLPAPMRPLVIWMVRRQITRDLWGHGMGRHSRDKINRLGAASLAAVSDLIADQAFLFGDEPCGFDASTYGFVAQALCPQFETPLLDAATRHPNLPAYRDRMTARYFPEFSG